MVSWIKSTASVTATICMVLVGPVVQPTFAQDASENDFVQTKSVNALDPEVRPISVEQDRALQAAIAQRAKQVADKRNLIDSIKPLPSVLVDDSLPSANQQQVADPSLYPETESSTVVGESQVSPAVAKNVLPAKGAEPTLASSDIPSPENTLTGILETPWPKKEVAAGSKVDAESNRAPRVAAAIIERAPLPSLANKAVSLPAALPPIIPADQLRVRGSIEPLLSETPTVVIRPPADDSVPVQDCHLEVKKIGDSKQDEFAVMLQVPDSVKVIEVLPNQSTDAQRKFKLRLDQEVDRDQQPATIQAPATVSLSFSDTNQVAGPQTEVNIPDTVLPIPQLRPLPPAQVKTPSGAIYQKNPFFKPTSKRATSRRTIDETPTQSFQQEPKHSQAVTPESGVSEAKAIQVVYRNPSESKEPDAVNVPYASDAPIETQSAANVAQSAKSAQSVVVAASLRSELTGPQTMKLNDTGDFTVHVTNHTGETANGIQVQLKMPIGMDVVVLDRQAWIDQTERTVTWRLPTILAGEDTMIHYRVQASQEGDIRQQISVDSEGQVSSNASIETRVVRSR